MKAYSNILVGYGFNKNNGPYFVIDDISQPATIRKYLSILDIQVHLYPILGKKLCIGTYDIFSKQTYPCPFKNKISFDSSYINCYKCYKEIGFHPRFLQKKLENISNKQCIYNERAHYVYLAYFGSGHIKVGTVHHDRLDDRLTEQGARAAFVIKKCANVYDASKLEQNICHEFSIPDKILTKKKISIIKYPFNFEEGKEALLTHALKMGLNKDELTILNMDKYYAPKNTYTIPHKLTEQTTFTEVIQCRIIGLIGKLLIFHTTSGNKVISIDRLISKTAIVLDS